MPRTFRYANKRIGFRSCGGRFRKATMADFGICGGCEKCGRPFVPEVRDLAGNPFVDPRILNERKRVCGDCLGVVVPPPPEIVPPVEPGTKHGQYGDRIEEATGSGYVTGHWRWCESCRKWEKAVGILAWIACPDCRRSW